MHAYVGKTEAKPWFEETPCLGVKRLAGTVWSKTSTLVRSMRNAFARLAGTFRTHYLFCCPVRFLLVLVSRFAYPRSGVCRARPIMHRNPTEIMAKGERPVNEKRYVGLLLLDVVPLSGPLYGKDRGVLVRSRVCEGKNVSRLISLGRMPIDG